MIQRIVIAGWLLVSLVLLGCKDKRESQGHEQPETLQPIEIADNAHFFKRANGDPFFWLGDTAWLLLKKLDREAIAAYFDDRKKKGFNVIQVMVLHTLDVENVYGSKALIEDQINTPNVIAGDSLNTASYDYWDHMAYAIDLAEQKGLYVALVPVWGGNVNSGKVSVAQAEEYGRFLGNRFKNNNIIWLNGGDTFGDQYTEVWNALGTSIHAETPQLLQTFHPRGRQQSSDWFHTASWLDFNMFQSGHRTYDQDDSEKGFGEDNWRYVTVDYNLKPTKPTLDGEPSYEGIPQGLHDTLQPLWNENDVRRYAYWSVFAGAAGFTYGHSAIMQFYTEKDGEGAYGNKMDWQVALQAEGAGQMQYLKQLMLSYPYMNRVPDEDLIVNQGERYNYLAATRGADYAMIYTYTGRTIEVHMDKIEGDQVDALWYNPKDGSKQSIGMFKNEGTQVFDPPGEIYEGNDWVLLLEST